MGGEDVGHGLDLRTFVVVGPGGALDDEDGFADPGRKKATSGFDEEGPGFLPLGAEVGQDGAEDGDDGGGAGCTRGTGRASRSNGTRRAVLAREAFFPGGTGQPTRASSPDRSRDPSLPLLPGLALHPRRPRRADNGKTGWPRRARLPIHSRFTLERDSGRTSGT